MLRAMKAKNRTSSSSTWTSSCKTRRKCRMCVSRTSLTPAGRLPGGDCGLHGHGELGERIFLVWRIHTCPYAAHRGGQRPRQDLFKDGMLELTLSKIEPPPEAIDQD